MTSSLNYSAEHQTTKFTNRIHHISAETYNILNKIQASDQCLIILL